MKFGKRSHRFGPKILKSTCTYVYVRACTNFKAVRQLYIPYYFTQRVVKCFKIKLVKQASQLSHTRHVLNYGLPALSLICPILIVLPCGVKSHVENSREFRRDIISYRQQPTSGIVYYSINIY